MHCVHSPYLLFYSIHIHTYTWWTLKKAHIHCPEHFLHFIQFNTGIIPDLYRIYTGIALSIQEAMWTSYQVEIIYRLISLDEGQPGQSNAVQEMNTFAQFQAI